MVTVRRMILCLRGLSLKRPLVRPNVPSPEEELVSPARAGLSEAVPPPEE